jgi:hypothetical protein
VTIRRLFTAAVISVLFAVQLPAHGERGVKGKVHNSSAAEPSRTFATIDKDLTSLTQQQATLSHTEDAARTTLAGSMRRTVISIERSSERLQQLYENKHEQFGQRMFRLLRMRAGAVRNAINSLNADTKRGQRASLDTLNGRILALVTQFQAASGGFSALRCEPSQWSCCTPKRKQDLRPGETLACRWMCTSTARACTGFRGPRAASPSGTGRM